MAGLKFRVLLDSKDQEKVFRDILISDEDNFESLYKTIIHSFNFKGDQMASFYMSNDDWDKGHEISLMDLSYGDDSIDELPSIMSKAILKDFMEEPDQKILLVYDFLKMWIFIIELIGFEEERPGIPLVLISLGNAPLEESKEDHISDLDFGDENSDDDGDDDDDDMGFNDFEDGFSEDDLSSYDTYDY